MFDIKVDIDAQELMDNLGIGTQDKAQKFFANEVMRYSDPYVPADSAHVLRMSARVTKDGNAITYTAPYARYHWYGKLMVDSKTGKGAFYNPKTGMFWSRPNTPKVLTDRDMKYQGAPLRGPRWVERAFIDNKETLLNSLQAYIESRGGANK